MNLKSIINERLDVQSNVTVNAGTEDASLDELLQLGIKYGNVELLGRVCMELCRRHSYPTALRNLEDREFHRWCWNTLVRVLAVVGAGWLLLDVVSLF
jgi:hypothetical protein